MNNKPKEMVTLDIDELGVIEWALEEGLKRLDEKIDDGTENDLSKKIGYRLRSRLYTMAYPVIIDGTDRRRMK